MGPLLVHRQGLVIAVAMVAVAASVWLLAAQTRDRVVQAGFWFEDVSFDASEVEADRLGGGITPEEMQTIEAVAWAELRAAFKGLRIEFTDRRDAAFSVRIIQDLRRPDGRRGLGAAGESHGLWPLGGYGMVNFRLLAGRAIAYAPAGTDRTEKIEAIGRGIGRAAAHEFAHQILGPIDQGRDRKSYDYRNADRPEQFYGPMHWEAAGPRLAARIGTNASWSR